MVRLVIEDFKHMAGYNCQLSSMKKVLAHGGIELSEPMILGLCSGLGFFYYYMKRMPFPMMLGLAVKKTEVFNLSRIGKKMEHKTIEFPIPEGLQFKSERNDDIEALAKRHPWIA